MIFHISLSVIVGLVTDTQKPFHLGLFRGAASQEVPVFACPPVRLPVSLYEDDILPLRLLRGLESVWHTPTSVACLGFTVSNLQMQKKLHSQCFYIPNVSLERKL